MDEVEKAIQRAIDKTPVHDFPRTCWGLRDMLASEGLEIILLNTQKNVDSP